MTQATSNKEDNRPLRKQIKNNIFDDNCYPIKSIFYILKYFSGALEKLTDDRSVKMSYFRPAVELSRVIFTMAKNTINAVQSFRIV